LKRGGGGDVSKITADLHYYKEKYEQATYERDQHASRIVEIEVTV
jgi:hypothetical protein